MRALSQVGSIMPWFLPGGVASVLHGRAVHALARHGAGAGLRPRGTGVAAAHRARSRCGPPARSDQTRPGPVAPPNRPGPSPGASRRRPRSARAPCSVPRVRRGRSRLLDPEVVGIPGRPAVQHGGHAPGSGPRARSDRRAESRCSRPRRGARSRDRCAGPRCSPSHPRSASPPVRRRGRWSLPEEERVRVVVGEDRQTLAQWRGALPQQGLSADEVGVLVERHGEAESGLVGAVIRADVACPRHGGLLQAQRLDRRYPASRSRNRRRRKRSAS